jgi:hypothetical protein
LGFRRREVYISPTPGERWGGERSEPVLVIFVTLVLCLVIDWANSQTGAPPDLRFPVLQVFVIDVILALMIAAMHWL